MGAITITLSRADAQAIADRIRDLHHRRELADVDLADAAEPLRWIIEPLAMALGEYGPGVRRETTRLSEEITG